MDRKLIPVIALLLLATVFDSNARAQNDQRTSPANRRMAFTDRSGEPGIQPRVWMSTFGGALQSRLPDVQISVTHDDTLIVTYSAVDNPELGRADPRVAWSTDGGATWQSWGFPSSLFSSGMRWDPSDLPYHCFRGEYFLGEYRSPKVVGNRAYHALHRSSFGNTVLTGMWSSRWSIVD